MKNTYIIVGVLVLLLVGGFFVLNNNKLEAPLAEENNPVNTENQVESTTTTEETAIPVNETTTSTEVGINIGNQQVKEFTVTGNNFAFAPSTITVNKGDKVKITFVNSEGFHDWKIDEFGAATKQTKAPTTEVIEFTADKTGSFEYYCSVGSHRAMGMKGTLTVK